MGRWMRGALALLVVVCAASPAASGEIPNNRSLQTTTTVQPTATGYWNGSRWVSWEGTDTGAQTLFYEANAIGPVRFRENIAGGSGAVGAAVIYDSTAAIDLMGATRLGIWIYQVPDTCCDTTLTALQARINWYALGVRFNLTAANDSSVVAPMKRVATATGTVGGVSNATYVDYVDELAASPAYVSTLLPGEILVPLKVAAYGVGGSRYFVLDVPTGRGGEAIADRVSFTLRPFGHWNTNPQATFIRNPAVVTRVRMDVKGYQ